MRLTGIHWFVAFSGAVLFLILAYPAAAVLDNEQSWIVLERDRPDEAITRCRQKEDFLSRWVLAVAEVRTAAKPTANDPASMVGRAFENGDFKQAADQLKIMMAAAPSTSDQLTMRLILGVCQLELGQAVEAEVMLTSTIDQATKEKRLASQCYGLLNRGRARTTLNQPQGAQDDLQDTIKLSRRLGTHRWAAMAALALSDVSRLVENQDDILYWLEAGLQYYRHAGDVQGQIKALELLGAALCEMDECEDGLVYLEEANALAHPQNQH